ncbi:MAG: efflux RND transporter permease subunit, partial [Desulfatitalea sp.]|nr:efflux RND transporter permease subunit [Desulfatitalea sp.]NNJ99697.1 efflux RND transporter permease subunit [Desulfatitalea sp.]
IMALGEEVDEKIDEFRRVYPHGVEMVRAASQDTFVGKSVSDFIVNLVQAVVAVLVSMLVFLGLRTGLIVASLIPVTIVSTLLAMSIVGVGLNQVSLAALIIALGILVDNAIVISEAIMVKMENGVEAIDAAISSARELAVPLLTSSLTTSAAFMSFFLAESVMGEIMGQLFVVVTISLLSSWLLSLTMITLFCVHGLKQKAGSAEKKPGLFERFSVQYKRFLLFNLRNRWMMFAALGVMGAAALFLVRFVPVIFMPKSDRAVVSVNLELPIGTDIERTSKVVDSIAAFIRKALLVTAGRPEGVESWSSYVGEGAPKYDLGYMPPEANSYSAHVLVNTTSDGITDHVVEAIDNYIFDHFPEATFTVSRLASGGGSVTPIEIRISGERIDTLYEITEQLKSALIQTAGTRNITDNWGLQTKKILVDIQNTQAQVAGVNNYDIAISLQTMLGGAVTGVYREADKSIPIVMQNSRSSQLDIQALEGLNIYAQQSGKSVPLKQVANLDVAWQPSKILRRDLTRTLTVGCDIHAGLTASEVLKRFSPWLEQAADQWPEGYTFELGGDAEGAAMAMEAVAAKLPLSVFIIILLLIAQFNSIRKLGIILATIPMGLIGVTFGLLVTGACFSFTSFLGIISLAGIVINNGIVLLDRINIEQTELGKSPQEAVTDAALGRFRPILLTTATTSLGLIPLWLGGGEMWEPMAIGIIFGLLFSTLLTLVFVPVCYAWLFRIQYGKGGEK